MGVTGVGEDGSLFIATFGLVLWTLTLSREKVNSDGNFLINK